MNYKLDGIPISNYGAKPVRTNQAFALHGMLDLPKRLSPTEYNWGTSIEPFVDAEDIKLDGRTLTLNVAIKKDLLQLFLDACIACAELEVFDESIGGRNLIIIKDSFENKAMTNASGGGSEFNDIGSLLTNYISVKSGDKIIRSHTYNQIAFYNKDKEPLGMSNSNIGIIPANTNSLTYQPPVIPEDKVIEFMRVAFRYNFLGGKSKYEVKVKIEKGNKATPWTPAPEEIFFPLPVLCRDEIKVNYVDDYAIVSVPFWQYQVTYNPVTILPSNTGEVRIDGYDLAKDFGIYIARSSDLDSVAKRIEVQTTEMYSRTNFRATRSIDINCTIKVSNTTDLFYKMNEFQAMLMKPGMREFKIRDNNYYVYFKDGMRVEVVANNIAKFNLKATVV